MEKYACTYHQALKIIASDFNLTNDNVIGYIDANGDLHAIVTIYFCAGRGQELQDIVIK